MIRVIELRGRFALIQSEAGFVWTVDAPDGTTWYWHPDEARWTCRGECRPTREAASAGLSAEALETDCAFQHHQTRRPAGPGEHRSPAHY